MLNLLSLAVDQKYQQPGIGKQLMQSIESVASELELTKIRLNSGEPRLGAHTFYESIGYFRLIKKTYLTKKSNLHQELVQVRFFILTLSNSIKSFCP